MYTITYHNVGDRLSFVLSVITNSDSLLSFLFHKFWQSFALSVITNADSLSSFLLSQILTVFHPFCYHKFWQSFVLSVITNSDSLSSFLLSQIQYCAYFNHETYFKINLPKKFFKARTSVDMTHINRLQITYSSARNYF